MIRAPGSRRAATEPAGIAGSRTRRAAAFGHAGRLAATIGMVLIVAASAVPADHAHAADRAGPARPAEAVAWVETDAASGRPPLAALRILRDGRSLPGAVELLPCDEVRVEEPGVIVRIATTGGRETLYGGTSRAGFRVPCGDPGLSARLMAVLRALAGESRTMPAAVMAATRGAGPDPAGKPEPASAPPAPMRVPSLGRSRTELAAGDRSLRLAWLGGKPPFSLRLVALDTDVVVASRHGVHASPVVLPPVNFAPGRYRLLLRDATGDVIDNQEIIVRDATQLPPPPAALRTASLSADEQSLMYAYWLEGLGDGSWTLEALQRIAALRDPPPAARAWLARYGAGR